ncbi:hypothetical protein UE98_31070 [Burkholderia cenocepacia]|jgi:hypothetical protein|nr:hypothetical protein UE98_31070 [Burkholderia cenocepacia]
MIQTYVSPPQQFSDTDKTMHTQFTCTYDQSAKSIEAEFRAWIAEIYPHRPVSHEPLSTLDR